LRHLRLTQNVTRIRGGVKPHILDLVLTNEPFINNTEYLSPLGKSDHSVLNIFLCAQIQNLANKGKYNYAKADYDGCAINWEDKLSPFGSDFENMWVHFTKELHDRISQFIPKQKDFNSIRKDTWIRPLNLALRELIAKKNRLWTRYIETRNSIIHKKYKSVRNKVRNGTRKLQIEERRQVASQCKDNPKIFWKFVNSKRKVHEHIGDLKTEDRNGNILWLIPTWKRQKH